MGLYLDIALASLEGSLRMKCLYVYVMMIYDINIMNVHIVDTIC